MIKPRDILAGKLGMWIFLGSEMLFFGSLFLAVSVYRHVYPVAFAQGTKHLSLLLGTVNTAVLLTSSYCLAAGLMKTDPRFRARWFWFTFMFGILFLALKFAEYYQHAQEGLFPGWHWDPPTLSPPELQLFFVLYLLLTGLHALHMTVGLGLIAWLAVADGQNRGISDLLSENIGLYWHFVDIMWVFIFPLLYLIGRN